MAEPACYESCCTAVKGPEVPELGSALPAAQLLLAALPLLLRLLRHKYHTP